jgi:hypothetical protein
MGRKPQGVKLPEIPWAQDDHKLVWDFITQLEKDVNYKILFGKKDPSEVSHYIRGTAAPLYYQNVDMYIRIQVATHVSPFLSGSQKQFSQTCLSWIPAQLLIV